MNLQSVISDSEYKRMKWIGNTSLHNSFLKMKEHSV